MPGFFDAWMDDHRPDPPVANLIVLREREGARVTVQEVIQRTALDHLAGMEIIEEMGGFPAAAAYIRGRIPERLRVMSGDLGEILASEYIGQRTTFTVPVKKLRWKDDRDVTMRGNDVIAGRDVAGRFQVLKAESKSRQNLSAATILEAITGLQKHSGRPNPSSLSFIIHSLRVLGNPAEAAKYESFQRESPAAQDVEHMVFTLSGNDPSAHMAPHAAAPGATTTVRHLVGCVVPDHQAFIRQTFSALNVPVQQ